MTPAPHTIPLGQIVEFDMNEREWAAMHLVDAPDGTEVVLGIVQGTLRLIVVGHHYDCDGTPLYAVADKPIAYPLGGIPEVLRYRAFVNLAMTGVNGEVLRPVHNVCPLMPLEEYERQVFGIPMGA